MKRSMLAGVAAVGAACLPAVGQAQAAPQGIPYQIDLFCGINGSESCQLPFKAPAGYIFYIQTISVTPSSSDSSTIFTMATSLRARQATYTIVTPFDSQGAVQNLTAFAQGKDNTVYVNKLKPVTGQTFSARIDLSGFLYPDTK